jgi:hypothetical protein
MKKIHSLLLFLCLFTSSLYFLACKKDGNKVNITLHDKPLSTIRSYIQGNWKLSYAKGGFCGTCVYPAKNNEYMTLSTKRIVFGNDSTGVVLDTEIIWKREQGIFYDSTYLLTYYYPAGYGPFPIAYIVDGVYNDTLKLIDNAAILSIIIIQNEFKNWVLTAFHKHE